jgi:IPT/TIG domain
VNALFNWLTRACARSLSTLLVGTVLLSGCGGGGGGGGGGGAASTAGSTDAFSLSINSVTFSSTEGEPLPPAKPVTVTANRSTSGTVYIHTEQFGSGFGHTFKITGQTGEITIVPSVVFTPQSNLPPGTYTGGVIVRGCSQDPCNGTELSGSPKSISVSHVIAPAVVLTTTPSMVDFETSAGVLPPPKELNLSYTSGSISWTSTVDYVGAAVGWLSVSPGSGPTLPQVVTFGVTSVPSPGLHRANVTIAGGGKSTIVPVTLSVHPPTVNFVSPYIAQANATDTVIIRGHGFAAAGLQVDFGGTPATSATFVSDSEIHATHPALLVGSYSINVRNGGGQPVSTRARLVVVAPTNFQPTVIERRFNMGSSPFRSGVSDIIYDAERKAVYLVDSDVHRLERYRFNGATWDGDSIITGGQRHLYRGVSLSPDGTQLLKSSDTTLSVIDPVTLALIASPTPGALLERVTHIRFTNDGSAIGNGGSATPGTTVFRYDMLSGRFTSMSTRQDMGNRQIASSGNGRFVVLATGDPLGARVTQPVFTFDSQTTLLSQTPVLISSVHAMSVSRTGSRILMTGSLIDGLATDYSPRVFDGSLVPQGILPEASSALVLSPNGEFAYVYYGASQSIRKFDLNSPISGGFSELGSGTAVTFPGTAAINMAMAISPDGGTLFLAGDERLLILPTP